MTGVIQPASEAVVDAALTVSRTLVAVSEQSLGGAAEKTALAQYRALVALASRGSQRMMDLATALGVTPSTSGRICDRLVCKDVIRRHRAQADRREVLMSITPAGRRVVDQATTRRRGCCGRSSGGCRPSSRRLSRARLPCSQRRLGRVPDSQWPEQPDGRPGRRPVPSGRRAPRGADTKEEA
jgi:DNA-binding MarR family transcriptional regulator